jgi:hypothetical protein
LPAVRQQGSAQPAGPSEVPACQGYKDDTQWSHRNCSLHGKVGSLCNIPGAGRADAKRSTTLENTEMTRPRIMPYVVTLGLVLGLSACTNPYDPVQRMIGGGRCNRGCGCRRTRSGAWRGNRRSGGCSGRPNHDATTARSLRILQSPALRLLQSPTIRELPPATTSLRRLRTSRGEHSDGHPINARLGCWAAGVIPCKRPFRSSRALTHLKARAHRGQILQTNPILRVGALHHVILRRLASLRSISKARMVPGWRELGPNLANEERMKRAAPD